MTQHSARRSLTLVLALSLLTSVGCATDGRVDDPSLEPTAVVPVVADPVRSSVQDCTSTRDASGLVCSTCESDEPGAAPECLAAQCFASDHCLRCTDPKGRVATDCRVDYDQSPGASWTVMPGDTWSMASCTFSWGIPNAAATTCYYPGPDTCVTTTEAEDWQCLSCRYPDGSGSGICGGELPDPQIGRPDDLPAPGTCVNELGADGLVQCTTCTHDDLSATRSCRYPHVVDCELPFDDFVWKCTLDDGSTVGLLNSTHGPQPAP